MSLTLEVRTYAPDSKSPASNQLFVLMLGTQHVSFYSELSLTHSLVIMRRRQRWKAHFQMLQHQADFHPEIRITWLPNGTPDNLKGCFFFSWHSMEHPFKIQLLTAK